MNLRLIPNLIAKEGITGADNILKHYVNNMHSIDCAKLGADVMTGPLSAIKGLLKHPLTDIGLAQFLVYYKKGN